MHGRAKVGIQIIVVMTIIMCFVATILSSVAIGTKQWWSGYVQYPDSRGRVSFVFSLEGACYSTLEGTSNTSTSSSSSSTIAGVSDCVTDLTGMFLNKCSDGNLIDSKLYKTNTMAVSTLIILGILACFGCLVTSIIGLAVHDLVMQRTVFSGTMLCVASTICFAVATSVFGTTPTNVYCGQSLCEALNTKFPTAACEEHLDTSYFLLVSAMVFSIASTAGSIYCMYHLVLIPRVLRRYKGPVNPLHHTKMRHHALPTSYRLSNLDNKDPTPQQLQNTMEEVTALLRENNAPEMLTPPKLTFYVFEDILFVPENDVEAWNLLTKAYLSDRPGVRSAIVTIIRMETAKLAQGGGGGGGVGDDSRENAFETNLGETPSRHNLLSSSRRRPLPGTDSTVNNHSFNTSDVVATEAPPIVDPPKMVPTQIKPILATTASTAFNGGNGGKTAPPPPPPPKQASKPAPRPLPPIDVESDGEFQDEDEVGFD